MINRTDILTLLENADKLKSGDYKTGVQATLQAVLTLFDQQVDKVTKVYLVSFETPLVTGHNTLTIKTDNTLEDARNLVTNIVAYIADTYKLETKDIILISVAEISHA